MDWIPSHTPGGGSKITRPTQVCRGRPVFDVSNILTMRNILAMLDLLRPHCSPPHHSELDPHICSDPVARTPHAWQLLRPGYVCICVLPAPDTFVSGVCGVCGAVGMRSVH